GVAAEPLAADALDGLLASIDRVRTRMRSAARLLGILLTQVDSRRPLTRETGERLRAEYRDQMFHTELRWTSALASAPAARRPPAGGGRRRTRSAGSVAKCSTASPRHATSARDS